MKTRYFNNAEVILFPDDLPTSKASPLNREAKWFDIRNQTDESADIFIYDAISPYLPGSNAKAVVAQLGNLKNVKQLNVRINSPGGSVFEGVAIYNALRRHPGTVHTHVDGLAASIASVIALAGSEVHIAENAMMMIHNPAALTMGTAADLRKEADVLDQIKETIINVYAGQTGKKRETLAKMMDDETWFTAKEALDAKFATKQVKAMKVAASFDVKVFGFSKTPENLLVPVAPETSTTPSNRHSRERRLALLERVAKQ